MLQNQFSCPTGCLTTKTIVKNSLLSPNNANRIYIQPATPDEIKKIIKYSSNRKSPGPDGISNTNLKKLSDKTILFITKIFSYGLRLNHFPRTYKLAAVIMIPKPGREHKVSANHRPMFLRNTLGKMLETVLLTRLKTATKHLIRLEQFAFRAEHSTTNQLTKLIDHLANSVNHGERTLAAFLDFEKSLR